MFLLKFSTMIRLFLFLFVLNLCGCNPRLYLLDSNFDYQGKFKSYRTFAFVNIAYSPIGAEEEAILKNIIVRRFEAMGYKYNDANPDLLISYKFFYEPTRIVGFNQHHLNSWVKSNSMQDLSEETAMDRQYFKQEINLPKDSFTVYFIDTKDYRMIWQGYSGQFTPWTHKQQLAALVGRMMDEYPIIVESD